MSVYKKLGVRTVINAGGWFTNIGGSLIKKEVLDAMNEAAGSFVFIEELQQRAGEVIARIAGAESGLVTAGAAAGLVLAAAACMAGTDGAKIRRLPETQGMRNEILIQRGHHVEFAELVRLAGARLVDVGYSWRTSLNELEAAMTDRSAAVLHVISHLCVQRCMLSLPQVVAAAKKHGVPVIVDAASEVPPVDNLRRFVESGADLVVFSGGKAIGGPNDTGFVCGRRDLVEACALQSSPDMGIGRPMKVSKEQIVGLVTALERYVQSDVGAELKSCDGKIRYLMDELSAIPHITVEKVFPDETGCPIPRAKLRLDEGRLRLTAGEVANALRNGTPPIVVREFYVGEGVLVLDAMCLRDGEERVVAERLQEILATDRETGIAQ
ncbi:MAG: aminotransferase class V-fold PLP-dependent enzyme [Aigarchaeota archaeon]|nr:aminotransferase class V-fold PLP-dependent enzyme [Aigarchaeota archaeon]